MNHVYKLLRVLLLVPILTAFLGFASINLEQRTEIDGMHVVSVDVGVWPWFHYEDYASHRSPAGFIMTLASEAENGPGVVEATYTHGYRWSFDLATWSILSGGVFLVLSLIYYRLGRAVTRTKAAVSAPPAAPAGP